MRLAEKIAIITGGADGIGLAVAETFLAQGCRVYVLDNNPTEKLSHLAADSDSCRFMEKT